MWERDIEGTPAQTLLKSLPLPESGNSMEGEMPSSVILEQDVDIRNVIEMARRATEEIIKAIGQDALDAAR